MPKSPRSHFEAFHRMPNSSHPPTDRHRRVTSSDWDPGDWRTTTQLQRRSSSANLFNTPVWSRSFDESSMSVQEPNSDRKPLSAKQKFDGLHTPSQVHNTPAGCSKRPDFSPAQPRRTKTRRSAGKAAASEDRKRTLWSARCDEYVAPSLCAPPSGEAAGSPLRI
jgi:hypothetical protein